MGTYQFTRSWVVEADTQAEAEDELIDLITETDPADWSFEVENLTTYKIIRFHDSGPSSVVNGGLTLAEAQAWCRREDTHGSTGEGRWFDGYEVES